MNNSTILETHKLSKSVDTAEGPLHILKGVDLKIKHGTSAAIVGSSGSGKTTLLGLLAGLDLPSSGSILIDGVDITQLDEEQRSQIRSQSIGFVFQSFHLLANLTALENVMLPLELKQNQQAQQQASEILAKVGLQDRLHHYPAQLSGGEQQRVAIARAFADQPKILFADEPTGNLDSKTANKIIELLFEMNQQFDTTLILVTHDMQLADRCDAKWHLEHGVLNLVSA